MAKLWLLHFGEDDVGLGEFFVLFLGGNEEYMAMVTLPNDVGTFIDAARLLP